MNADEWNALAQWVLVAAALVGAWLAVKQARGAKKEGKRAAAIAEESKVIAAESRDAQVRMADALERQVRGAGAHQDGDRTPSETSPSEDNPDVDHAQVAFIIEPRGKTGFVLRNLGPATATGVTTIELPENLPSRGLPIRDVTLRPFESHEFSLFATFQASVPNELVIRCDQLDQPVLVPVPHRF